MDVPVSLSVIDSEFMAEQGLTDLQDISTYVPNAGVRSSRGAAAAIRGFTTSSLNKAFDQSVGLVVDGTPYNRAPYLEMGLFDVSRIEVLRGPQGHLFGKSSSAGVLNIITARPTDEYTGFVDGQLGELGRRRGEAAVGGPLVAGVVNFRIAALYDGEDGLIENTFARVRPDVPPTLRDKEIYAGRAKLLFPDVWGTEIGLSFERMHIDYNSTGAELGPMTPGSVDFWNDFDPNLDSTAGNYRTSQDGPDDQTDVATIFSLDWRTTVAGWDVSLLVSHATLDSKLNVDFDFLPAAMIHVPSRDDNPQTTVEVRTVSPTLAGLLGLSSLFGLDLGGTDLTVGAFYQNRRLVDDKTSIEINTPLLLLAAVAAGDSSPFPLGLNPSDLPGDLGIESSTMFFGQNANAFAAFSNLEWRFWPKWSLTSGLRLSVENKKAVWKRIFPSPTHIIFTQSLNWREFELRDERTDFDVVPKIALGFRPTDGISVFASWTKGIKGSGFNDTASGPSGPEREFEKEQVTQWEIDSRWTLLDGRLGGGLTLYRMDLEDFQLITSRPQDLVQVVENIGLLRAQGIEVDATALPFPELTVIGTLGLNDATYIEFPFGPCPLSQPDIDGDGDPRCDFAGRQLVGTPRWNISMTPILSLAVESILPALVKLLPGALGDVVFETSITGVYLDATHIGNNPFDRRANREKLFVFGGRMGFLDPGKGWSVSLHGRNLTDEYINVARFEISGLPDNYFNAPEPGRLLFGQVRYQFQ